MQSLHHIEGVGRCCCVPVASPSSQSESPDGMWKPQLAWKLSSSVSRETKNGTRWGQVGPGGARSGEQPLPQGKDLHSLPGSLCTTTPALGAETERASLWGFGGLALLPSGAPPTGLFSGTRPMAFLLFVSFNSPQPPPRALCLWPVAGPQSVFAEYQWKRFSFPPSFPASQLSHQNWEDCALVPGCGAVV